DQGRQADRRLPRLHGGLRDADGHVQLLREVPGLQPEGHVLLRLLLGQLRHARVLHRSDLPGEPRLRPQSGGLLRLHLQLDPAGGPDLRVRVDPGYLGCNGPRTSIRGSEKARWVPVRRTKLLALLGAIAAMLVALPATASAASADI